MQTPLRKSVPGPPNSSNKDVSCTAPATENASFRSSSNVPQLLAFLEMLQNPHVLLTFDKMHNSLRLPRETTTKSPKVDRTPSTFNLLISKRVSCHNGVHFFDTTTSKSEPKLAYFIHVHFDMCFALYGRLIFYFIWSDGSVPAALATLFFDPPKPQIIRKTQGFAIFLPFHTSRSSFF